MQYPGQSTFYRGIADAYVAAGDVRMAQLYLERDPRLSGGELRSLLGSLEKRHSRFQRSGKLRMGAFYDGNANQGPASSLLDLGAWQVDVPGAEKIPSGGVYLGGNTDMAYHLGRSNPWWVVGDLHFQTRFAGNRDLRDAERTFSQWYRAAFGVKRLSARDLFDFRLKAEAFDYDFYQTVYSLGGEFTFVHVVNARLHLISNGALDYRDYVRDGTYSGLYSQIGQYARWYFGSKKNEFLLGGRYIKGDADADSHSYNAWELSASLRLKPTEKLDITPNLSYIKESYNGPATALEPEDRKDERLKLGLDLLYRVNDKVSLEFFYSYTDNSSNSALYDYDRHMFSAGFAWNF
jgi:hypothetical protein